MIGYLRGKPLTVSPESVLLDVGGVGYALHIPLSTFSEVDRAGGAESIGLHVHTHVRDDAIELFGFWTLEERRLFERLIGVGGIGPKLARVILSGMTAGDLVGALAAGDAARLTSIPGVGKKTAQRMIVELKDRISELTLESTGATAVPSAGPEDDVVTALVNLGYRAADAEKAVAAARRESPDGEFQDLIRRSLARLSRA